MKLRLLKKIIIFLKKNKQVLGFPLALLAGYFFGKFSPFTSYELVKMWFARFDWVQNLLFIVLIYVSKKTFQAHLTKYRSDKKIKKK